jgi:hypothetical protein
MTSYYRHGSWWIAVQSGMPEQPVRLGYGETRERAAATMEPTAIQSAGRYPHSAAIRWALHAGWLGDGAEWAVTDEDGDEIDLDVRS